MSRFLPLVILVIWMCGPSAPALGGLHTLSACAIFLGIYVVLVAILATWSRRVARLAHFASIQRRVRRFNTVIYASRILIPAWLAVGIFALGWKQDVSWLLDQTPLGRLPIDCPGLFLGCCPPFITWMALWWAQFPADQALREQNILIQLDQDLPLQTPPSFRTYFVVNLRLQLLFTIAPVLLLLLLHDGLSLILPPIFHRIAALADHEELIETIITLLAFALFVVFSPEILRRVLQTETLPDCPLRRRLQIVARKYRVGYRDVLLWKTHSQMGNAAVMGFVPRFRYVLLSDLLLETMRDEQIEAIFAHELGHVMHRHLYWLVAAMVVMLFAIAGPGQMIADALQGVANHLWLGDLAQEALLLGAVLGLFAMVFGYFSRKFERQADVFAARTMQTAFDESAEKRDGMSMAQPVSIRTAILEEPGIALAPVSRGYVGRHGAAVFCSALERVAVVNNIPVAARSWCHGSIAKRMRFLENLSRDPGQTMRFDRFMYRLYVVLLLCLCAGAVWTLLVFRSFPS
ncbi:MAG TPA: M48 family metallopeptidase [Tepidisphaeraceae bacterium]|jgi:STE24 endopeptidase|nr:M48 family metallopeptidase [Tepidisphaeraceae bacterium]